MGNEEIPPPPEGYQAGLKFEYPKEKLQLLAVGLLVILLPFLLLLTWRLRGGLPPGLLAIGLPEVGLMVGTIAATIVVHEAVHGLVYRLLGYRVTFGVSWRLGAAYAAAFGQWQSRRDNVWVALAPLLLLTPLLVGLLAVGGTAVTLSALVALLFNSSGAVGDLYLTWRLLRRPPETLLYDVNTELMLIYVPEAE